MEAKAENQVHAAVAEALRRERQAIAAVLRREQQARRDEAACVVCLEAPKTHAFLPCMHRCVCAMCAADVTDGKGECPLCRRKAKDVRRVY